MEGFLDTVGRRDGGMDRQPAESEMMDSWMDGWRPAGRMVRSER